MLVYISAILRFSFEISMAKDYKLCPDARSMNVKVLTEYNVTLVNCMITCEFYSIDSVILSIVCKKLW